MKACPHCGKNIPDYAKQCKYCDQVLPESPAPPEEHSAQAFVCPGCGAPLTYTGGEPVIVCSYCNNSVVVPETLRQASAPQAALSQVPQTLAEELAQLVQQGKREKAVTLLRDRAFLLKHEAEDLVARIETGEYGDLGRLIYNAQRGKDSF